MMLLSLLVCCLSLSSCISSQVICNAGTESSKLSATQRETDTQTTPVSATLPIGVGAQPNISATGGTANGGK